MAIPAVAGKPPRPSVSFPPACGWSLALWYVLLYPPIYSPTWLFTRIYSHLPGHLVHLPLPSLQWSPLCRLNRSLDRSTSAMVLASPSGKTIRKTSLKPHAH